jgi:hypothetical protein
MDRMAYRSLTGKYRVARLFMLASLPSRYGHRRTWWWAYGRGSLANCIDSTSSSTVGEVDWIPPSELDWVKYLSSDLIFGAINRLGERLTGAREL